MVVDVYPASSGQEINANFQLFGSVRVKGVYKPKPLPPPSSTQTIDGYHSRCTGRGT